MLLEVRNRERTMVHDAGRCRSNLAAPEMVISVAKFCAQGWRSYLHQGHSHTGCKLSGLWVGMWWYVCLYACVRAGGYLPSKQLDLCFWCILLSQGVEQRDLVKAKGSSPGTLTLQSFGATNFWWCPVRGSPPLWASDFWRQRRTLILVWHGRGGEASRGRRPAD